MKELTQVGPKNFYTPSKEALETLNTRDWLCSYSGGKDSTSLVTWIEWLRRSGQVKTKTPRLVHSNTEVELPFLDETANILMEHLSKFGWKCERVRPLIDDKLYNAIFGKGLSPVHPAFKRMRWCTNSTKIKPMDAYAKTLEDGIVRLTGIRFGESTNRDEKLAKSSCQVGGECGLPMPDESDNGPYAPIVNWKTCQVIDWLSGLVGKEVTSHMKDIFEITKELMDVYYNKPVRPSFGFIPITVKQVRFGCIACPALNKDKALNSQLKRHPRWEELTRIYGIWRELRRPINRLRKEKKGRMVIGPIKMEVRKKWFPELLKIQKKAGITLVNDKDIEFIYQCWENDVYPKGWSKEDEG